MKRWAGRIGAGISLLAALASPLVARGKAADSVVARVNGVPVTRIDVRREIDRLLPMASYHGRIDQEAWKRVVNDAVQAATDRELLYQAARKQGLSVSGKVLDQIESRWIARAGSRKSLDEWLEARGLSPNEFRDLLRKDQLVETMEKKVSTQIESRPAPSDAELKKYYEENRNKFMIPPSADIQHILVRVQPWQPEEEWKRAEKRAAWIAKRGRTGEGFDRLARTYSDDPESKKTGGRMNEVHEGSLTGPVEALVKGLEPGGIGGPVRSLYGYHIVKLVARHPARQLAFAQINREQLRTDLRRKAIREGMDGWRRGLRKNARIVLDQGEIELLRSPGGNAPSEPGAGPRRTE
ncbi:MAG: hypothetical protein A2Y95_03920 [Deltaproteobacteria bacterium RBG_13_65_10]|nr:MAG: hypothetical protein A2Y95_03920 [Deltaproteobacteria bacterium RBG_13_65_10]